MRRRSPWLKSRRIARGDGALSWVLSGGPLAVLAGSGDPAIHAVTRIKRLRVRLNYQGIDFVVLQGRADGGLVSGIHSVDWSGQPPDQGRDGRDAEVPASC
jgi:hypothetical protein